MTEFHPRYMKPCTAWKADRGEACGKTPTKFYPFGARCKDDAPPAVKPDPALTLVALRERAGIPQNTAPTAAPTAVDAQAIASGKRRASTAAVRAAREQIARKR